MDTVLELLKYILPSFITFGATYFVLKKFMDNEYRKQMLLLRKETKNETLPLRLQAFERLTLYLERISLDKLVLRVHKPGMSAKLLQAELKRNINDEFDHNLAQQIYMSATTWDIIKKAKDESLKAIAIASTQMKDNSTGMDLAQKIFEIMSQLEASPTQIAINQIKKELRQLF